jgi:hypothetical protein
MEFRENLPDHRVRPEVLDETAVLICGHQARFDDLREICVVLAGEKIERKPVVDQDDFLLDVIVQLDCIPSARSRFLQKLADMHRHPPRQSSDKAGFSEQSLPSNRRLQG